MQQALAKDLHRYLINVNIINEPEMYFTLLCFMIKHEFIWFSEDHIVDYLQDQFVPVHNTLKLNADLVEHTLEEQMELLLSDF